MVVDALDRLVAEIARAERESSSNTAATAH
jgi:hypothetical protein